MHIKGGSIEMTGRRSIDQTMISEYSKSRMDLANKKAYIDQEISLQDYLYAQSANMNLLTLNKAKRVIISLLPILIRHHLNFAMILIKA